MRLKFSLSLIGTVATIATLAGAAIAQGTTTTTTQPAPKHRMGGLLGRMHSAMRGQGQIVGNKNTKVYHLPGDTGNMPAEKNRVYFRTEREAIAAGYHVAGKRGSGTTRRSHLPGSMGQMGSTTSTSGGKMNSHLPK
jgi:hypothetical protein